MEADCLIHTSVSHDGMTPRMALVLATMRWSFALDERTTIRCASVVDRKLAGYGTISTVMLKGQMGQ